MDTKNIKIVRIGGVDYPAIFSVSTLEVIESEFGSLDGLDSALNDNSMASLSALIRIIRSMLVDASEYIHYMGIDIPTPDIPPERILKIAINPADVQSAMFGVLLTGDRDVVAEAKDDGDKKKEDQPNQSGSCTTGSDSGSPID